jgi:hypothetical protein
LIFEIARRVAKRLLRLASSDRDPHQRFAKNHSKLLLFFGLPNGALLGEKPAKLYKKGEAPPEKFRHKGFSAKFWDQNFAK